LRPRRVVTCLAVAIALAAPAGAPAAPVETHGYITVPDGTQLKFDLLRPAADGRFPVGLVYDGYCEGDRAAACNDPALVSALLESGYAVLGVNVRGSGCSGGRFDFREPQWSRDGAAVVEWAAAQPWSTGRVGMFGDSFPGLTQPGIAALRPRGLAAIAPFQIIDDPYRDVGYPGGIFNQGFAAFWGLANQPAGSATNVPAAISQGDAVCARHFAEHTAQQPQYNVVKQARDHPYDDEIYEDRGIERPEDIDVPVLACLSWQDDEISSRNGSYYFDAIDPRRLWVIATNGYHSMCDRNTDLIVRQTVRFFDRFVKGVPNGFEATPHVQLWHEATQVAAQNKPSWVTPHGPWPLATRQATLHLRRGGRLDRDGPRADEGGDTYGYPRPAASMEDGIVAGQSRRLWKAPFDAAGAVVYTTPALERDTMLFGPASADLWLRSTAADTDVQVTITEVRPDGQETYVQRGWLRASHRKLDAARSTALRPWHTHEERDAAPLPSGDPALLRVEVLPFNHVFRAGSSIRLIVDAPTGVTGGWSFDFLRTPATNTIVHDAAHPSKLVVGLLPEERARAPLPGCDTLLNQPCRRSVAPVPDGRILLAPDSAVASANAGALGLRVAGPRPCTSRRRITVTLTRKRGVAVRWVRVYIDGRRRATLRTRRLRVPVSLTGLPRGAFTVRLVARVVRGGRGERVALRRRYRTCRPPRAARPRAGTSARARPPTAARRPARP
jgi:uncharacterized protein